MIGVFGGGVPGWVGDVIKLAIVVALAAFLLRTGWQLRHSRQNLIGFMVSMLALAGADQVLIALGLSHLFMVVVSASLAISLGIWLLMDRWSVYTLKGIWLRCGGGFIGLSGLAMLGVRLVTGHW